MASLWDPPHLYQLVVLLSKCFVGLFCGCVLKCLESLGGWGMFLNACEVTGEGLSACFRDEPHVKRENRPACPARAYLATQAGHGACGSPSILHLPRDTLPSV